MISEGEAERGKGGEGSVSSSSDKRRKAEFPSFPLIRPGRSHEKKGGGGRQLLIPEWKWGKEGGLGSFSFARRLPGVQKEEKD